MVTWLKTRGLQWWKLKFRWNLGHEIGAYPNVWGRRNRFFQSIPGMFVSRAPGRYFPSLQWLVPEQFLGNSWVLCVWRAPESLETPGRKPGCAGSSWSPVPGWSHHMRLFARCPPFTCGESNRKTEQKSPINDFSPLNVPAPHRAAPQALLCAHKTQSWRPSLLIVSILLSSPSLCPAQSEFTDSSEHQNTEDQNTEPNFVGFGGGRVDFPHLKGLSSSRFYRFQASQIKHIWGALRAKSTKWFSPCTSHNQT